MKDYNIIALVVVSTVVSVGASNLFTIILHSQTESRIDHNGKVEALTMNEDDLYNKIGKLDERADNLETRISRTERDTRDALKDGDRVRLKDCEQDTVYSDAKRCVLDK